jgi:hypothetical protein
MAPSEAAWERLGELLTQRRAQLNPRYGKRTTFAAERGLNYRVAYEVEQARRHNFGDGTLAVIESAYELVPGSLKRTLNDGPLEPASRALVPPAPPAGEPSHTVSPTTATAIGVLVAPVISDVTAEVNRARMWRPDATGEQIFPDRLEARAWNLTTAWPEPDRIEYIAWLRVRRADGRTAEDTGYPPRRVQ